MNSHQSTEVVLVSKPPSPREQGGRDWDTVTTLASECSRDSLPDTRELLLFLKEDCGLAVSREEVLMLIRLQTSTIGLTVQGRQVGAVLMRILPLWEPC